MSTEGAVDAGDAPTRSPLSGAAALLLALTALAWCLYETSPPDLITTTPPVYHDDHTVLSPSVALSEGRPPAVIVHEVSPELAELFGGESRALVPGLSAGFSAALAGWFKMFGVGVQQARMFCMVCGCILIAATFQLGRLWWGTLAGLTAALLLALDGAFWYAARTVRPETFTAACYVAAMCLLSHRGPQPAGRRLSLAGLLFGVGLTGHPMGFALAPMTAVCLFSVPAQRTVRSLLRFGLPTAFVVGIYIAFLAVNRNDVQTNLAVHNVHKPASSISSSERAAREWERYKGTYANHYMLARGNRVRRIGIYGCLCLLLVAGITASGRRVVRRPAAWFAGGCIAAAIVLAVLARDVNFIYLTMVLPLVYLAAAAAASYSFWETLGRRSTALLAAGRALWLTVLAVYVVSGVADYRKGLQPYRDQPVAAFETVEEIIAAHIEGDAVVIGMESAWLAARSADAEFVYNQMIYQWQPEYRAYPIRAGHELSFVTNYELDVDVVRRMATGGRAVYFVADTWDWGWNYFYPNGRRSGSYASLMEVLRADFTPVLKLWSRDRGFTTVYRFGPGKAPLDEVYVESRRHRLGERIEPDAPVALPQRVKPGDAQSTRPAGREVARYTLKPGGTYLVQIEAEVDAGDFVMMKWNAAYHPKYIQATDRIVYEVVVRAEQVENTLAFGSLDDDSALNLFALTLTELIPAAEAPE